MARKLLSISQGRLILVMSHKRIIDELKQLLRKRGKITKEQREYAKAEENAMLQMYPISKPLKKGKRLEDGK